jgi:hypothetical protein
MPWAAPVMRLTFPIKRDMGSPEAFVTLSRLNQAATRTVGAGLPLMVAGSAQKLTIEG